MSLFYNYNNAGKGVAKNGPKKKPFFQFWEIFGRKFWKFFLLNVVYLLCCIPVVTFGPATAALTHVMRKFVLEKPIFVFDEFFTAFKKNFKASVGIGIVDVVFIAAFIYGLIFYNGRIDASNNMSDMIMMALMIAAATVFLIANYYIYMEIVALNLKMKAMIKNGLILTIVGLKNNLITLLIILGFVSIFYLLFPYSMIVFPLIPFAWISFSTVFICYPVIQRTIINPFYEAKGEVNPELLALGEQANEAQEQIFVDRGGSETPISIKKIKKTGKMIR